MTDGKSSHPSLNNNSAHSDSTPSSYTEADGIQNEGKRKDETSAQQEGLPPHPDGIPSDDNGSNYQKPNSYYDPNGNQSDK